MVAGRFGPAAWESSPAAPSPTHYRTTGNGNGAREAETSEDDSEEAAGSSWTPVYGDAARGPITLDPFYRQQFGSAFLEDAVLRMFCEAAKLNGLLFGDNIADPEMMSDTQASEMADLARELVDSIQVLLGPVHTTKLHRLAHHLLMEIAIRGNLWEGDTSVNESRHATFKRMFRRSTKSGPTLMLQMLRADETQDEVFATFNRAEREAERQAEADVAYDMAAQIDPPADADRDALDELLALDRRGIPASLAAISGRAGMEDLTAVLRVPAASDAVMANTLVIRAVFAWGSIGVRQHVRGADNFRGAPWYSHIRYRSPLGETRWGMVRLVLRAVAGVRRPVVVVQRYRRIAPRKNCVLSEFGCVRLAWDFASPDSEWPRLEAVEAVDILRLDQIHVDWQDLCARKGIFATPTTMSSSVEERRNVRFFVNVFYPWTSRAQTVL